MTESTSGFLRTTAGRNVVYATLILSVALASYIVYGAIKGSGVVAAANDRIFVDVSNGKPFHVRLEDLEGQGIPIKAPYSGTNTGYPAELCYWTADGQIKKEPTAVVLNNLLGKPGPTFCPDCGRLVVGHNPKAAPGMRPPLTQAEWQKRHPG